MNAPMETTETIGLARCVLVFGPDSAQSAVLTGVTADWSEAAQTQRITFHGSFRFSVAVQKHVRTTITTLLEHIFESLGLGFGRFNISGVNLSAASNMDIPTEVNGFSADSAIFLAMLSARLRIPVLSDVVSTGHVASSMGDIRLVRNIPAKLDAVRRDGSIRRFLFPRPDADLSIGLLDGNELELLQAAVAKARTELSVVSVESVADILKACLSEYAIVTSALDQGYALQSRAQPGEGCLRDVQNLLAGDIRGRLFRLVESRVVGGSLGVAGELLKKWIAVHVAFRVYPKRFGRDLRALILSLPPSTRSSLHAAPLVPVKACVALSQFAGDADSDDVLDLYRCVSATEKLPGPIPPSERPGSQDRAPQSVEKVLREISREHLSATIGVPIDAARASFLLDSVIAESQSEALEIVASFYIHLMRSTGRLDGDVSIEEAGPESLKLLDQAFAGEGGQAAAVAEACSAVRGGLRHLCDRMADQFKKERNRDHVFCTLMHAVDRNDWAERLEFTMELLSRCPEAVPCELADEPPERFVGKWELIAQTYVESMDRVNELLRTM